MMVLEPICFNGKIEYSVFWICIYTAQDWRIYEEFIFTAIGTFESRMGI